ncbi:hypothetical protein ACOSP7_008843 [Xanthoceras sorbifolium]
MVNTTSFYLPLLILSVVLHLLFVKQNTATITIWSDDGVSLIRESCNGSHYPDTCISVLEADSRSIATTNLKSLARVSLDIVYEEVTGLVSLFTKARENATDHFLKQNIDLCINEFDLSSHHVKEDAIPAFEKGDYQTTNDQVGYCVDSAGYCNDTGIKLFNKEIQTLYNFSADVLHFCKMLSSGRIM